MLRDGKGDGRVRAETRPHDANARVTLKSSEPALVCVVENWDNGVDALARGRPRVIGNPVALNP